VLTQRARPPVPCPRRPARDSRPPPISERREFQICARVLLSLPRAVPTTFDNARVHQVLCSYTPPKRASSESLFRTYRECGDAVTCLVAEARVEFARKQGGSLRASMTLIFLPLISMNAREFCLPRKRVGQYGGEAIFRVRMQDVRAARRRGGLQRCVRWAWCSGSTSRAKGATPLVQRAQSRCKR